MRIESLSTKSHNTNIRPQYSIKIGELIHGETYNVLPVESTNIARYKGSLT
jgi:hypothetical protein